MKFAEIDASQFPVVVIRINPKEASKADVEEHMHESYEFVQSQTQMFVSVYDLTNLKYLSSEARIQLGEWTKQNKALFQKHIAGVAYYSPSVVTSMLLKGIFLISPPPTVYIIAGSIEEALTWARERVKNKARS